MFEEFIQRFGKWHVTEACAMEDLPFIEDIRSFFDERTQVTGDFETELAILINKNSKENDSDTPDFLLAKYLMCCLDNFNSVINARDDFYGESRSQQLTQHLGGVLERETEKQREVEFFKGHSGSS